MDFQTAIVILLVSACSAYAVWQLMPQVARKGLAKVFLRAPWPARFAAWLQKVALAEAGCGCSGCDQALPKLAAQSGKKGEPVAQAMVFYPPKRR